MSKEKKHRKNPHAVALGKLGGRKRGPQPWKALGISRQAWYKREAVKRERGKA